MSLLHASGSLAGQSVGVSFVSFTDVTHGTGTLELSPGGRLIILIHHQHWGTGIWEQYLFTTVCWDVLTKSQDSADTDYDRHFMETKKDIHW
jgi:hypothetical protein